MAMKRQLDEKQDLIHKIESISSIEDIRQLKVFIAGMEAGKNLKEIQSKGKSCMISTI